MKTERLYYSDSYLRAFDARIVQASDGPGGLRVYLDRTAFYPDSGGQPADRGHLGGIPVFDVVDEGDAVAHLVGERPEGNSVKGVIEWERRFDHMQQHTGQYILSAAFEKAGAYKTVSFHMGAEVSSIDLDSDRVNRRQASEVEALANEIIFEDRALRIFLKPEAEASRMDLRKPSARKGEVRVIEIPDFDLSACGGTHVGRTGAVGLILIRKMDHTKGMTRVEFVCGGRALRNARSDYAALSEAAREFSTSLENVPALIRKQSGDLSEAIRTREKLAGYLADYLARELCGSAPVKNGCRIVRRVFDQEEIPGPKSLARALAALPGVVALLGVKGQPAGLYFAQSQGAGRDMAALLRRVLEHSGGKGGGTRDFAQGGGLEEGKLEDALSFAESLVG